jgi:hypothetical protein
MKDCGLSSSDLLRADTIAARDDPRELARKLVSAEYKLIHVENKLAEKTEECLRSHLVIQDLNARLEDSPEKDDSLEDQVREWEIRFEEVDRRRLEVTAHAAKLMGHYNAAMYLVLHELELDVEESAHEDLINLILLLIRKDRRES